jgi:hypothetical protein
MNADVIRGVAALKEMLDCIGNTELSDAAVSKILCDYEMELRALLFQTCSDLADAMLPMEDNLEEGTFKCRNVSLS